MNKYQQLDFQLAKLLGLSCIGRLNGDTFINRKQDSRVPCVIEEGTLFSPTSNNNHALSLMCEYELDIVWMGDKMFRVENSEGTFGTTTYIVDHDGCKETAMRFAVVECIISLLENN